MFAKKPDCRLFEGVHSVAVANLIETRYGKLNYAENENFQISGISARESRVFVSSKTDCFGGFGVTMARLRLWFWESQPTD